MTTFFTGMNIPLGNSVYNANFSEQNVKEKIDTIISQANRIKIPFLWWVGVLSKPHNLGEYLVEAGLIKHETTGMYLNLSKLDEKQYHKAVDQSKITISRVSNPKEEEEWIDVCAVAFEVDESKDEISYIWRTFFKHSDAYLATYEGKPVGISLVLYSSGVAGIYCVGVCPEFRNRGIGKAITMAPLLQAKKKGYEISILMSSELGFNVYSQIGYKECCKYGLYTYTPGNENEGK